MRSKIIDAAIAAFGQLGLKLSTEFNKLKEPAKEKYLNRNGTMFGYDVLMNILDLDGCFYTSEETGEKLSWESEEIADRIQAAIKISVAGLFLEEETGLSQELILHELKIFIDKIAKYKGSKHPLIPIVDGCGWQWVLDIPTTKESRAVYIAYIVAAIDLVEQGAIVPNIDKLFRNVEVHEQMGSLWDSMVAVKKEEHKQKAQKEETMSEISDMTKSVKEGIENATKNLEEFTKAQKAKNESESFKAAKYGIIGAVTAIAGIAIYNYFKSGDFTVVYSGNNQE